MTDIKNLYEKIETEKQVIKKYKPEILDIPHYISENLKYTFFDWQREAFENFLVYQEDHKKYPTHLMFNMATGTGKTLLMAATILYYYKQGYRHFLFFVNQNNIVDKTENNFIDNTHTKYLFKEKIVIDDNTINIKKIDAFSDNPQGIEIKFTSIQKLYNDIHLQRENQTSLDDLNSKNIVMLADEAHHLNAVTKTNSEMEFDFAKEITNRTSSKDTERKGWEHTVIELILNKNHSRQTNSERKINKNVLLEFTATIPENQKVNQKYHDKIIYKFGLKEFLQAGYTKQVNLISSSFTKKERVLQALLFQWYRHKIALKYNISNFKPVILFRSKTIKESKRDHNEFLILIDQLSLDDYEYIKTVSKKMKKVKEPSIFEMGKQRLDQVLDFIEKGKVSFGEIVNWIKQNFQDKNVIITNSRTNRTKTEKTDEETEKLLNSLEDKNNHIRAIFTVSRLTEGWDVLNLFDIVRLYKGRDEGRAKTGKRKAGSSTIAEKQLIGRGVRYFPFSYQDHIKNKRKFDGVDMQHELRIMEELYFHSTSDHRYIDELKRELKRDGFIPENRKIVTFDLKKEFKESDFYQNTIIWYNKKQKNPYRKKKNLNNINKDFFPPFDIPTFEYQEQELNWQNFSDQTKQKSSQQRKITLNLSFLNIDKNIFYKAINIKAKQENSIFQFENLQKELNIETIDDLRKKRFLGNFKIKVKLNYSPYFDEKNDLEIFQNYVKNKHKLDMLLKFLNNFEIEFKKNINPYTGSDFIAGNFNNFFSEPKQKAINEKKLDDEIVKNNDWYILNKFAGTSEEKSLITFIKDSFGNLQRHYDKIFLLRNEEVFKIYDFEYGRGFQPDFILFLKSKDKKQFEVNENIFSLSLFYQVFIEPKQKKYATSDDEIWKEKFLNQITKKYGKQKIIIEENLDYRLIGLPFYNSDPNILHHFEIEFNDLIKN